MIEKEQLYTLLSRKAFQQELSELIQVDLSKRDKLDKFIDLIQNVLEKTDSRNIDIIFKRFIKFYTLDRLAEEYSVTKERIRQIILEVEKEIADEYFSTSYKNNPEEAKSLLKIPITDVGLSFRTSTALKAGNINTLEELQRHSEEELLSIKGIGLASVKEITERFDKLGFILQQGWQFGLRVVQFKTYIKSVSKIDK